MTTPLSLAQAIAEARAIADTGPEPDNVRGEAAGFGRFEGIPAKVEFSADDSSGRLLEAVSYISEDGEAWPVPVGAWLDGASIPRVFWTVVGDPYGARYREPSIVHDHYCIVRTRSWRDTHRMFHQAMLCRDVAPLKARVMFYAVYRFGPRWTVGSIAEAPAVLEPAEGDAPSISRDVRLIRDQDLDVGQIEALVDRERPAE